MRLVCLLYGLNSASPLPACGERSARQRRVRGNVSELALWSLPLTPTLSERAALVSAPQAGRGSRRRSRPRSRDLGFLAGDEFQQHRDSFLGFLDAALD